MDTLTHGIIGALAARSCSKGECKKSRLAVTACAAAFPDIDYLLFWLNPYNFITEWHRGITHSVIMLPIWSALISTALFFGLQKRISFRILFACCSLGMLTHIVMDLFTVYGIQLFSPLSERRFALFTVFDIDPWIGVFAGCALIPGLYRGRYAVSGLLIIVIYLLVSFNFQLQAQTILDRRIGQYSLQSDSSYAIPQPLLPFHWKLVVDRHDHYEIALLSLFPTASQFIDERVQMLKSSGFMQEFFLSERGLEGDFGKYRINDFRSYKNLVWKIVPKFGNTMSDSKLARQVWRQPAFAKFRHFATFPVLYRIDQEPHSECAWFTDLRYVFPLMIPPFRYGMCRANPDKKWTLFRLRRQTQNDSQWMPSDP